MAPPVGYVAFIDEAGDDGLQSIKTNGTPGASEWLAISAVVVRIEREQEVVGWVRNILDLVKQPQMRYLHFRDLKDPKKHLVCQEMAKLPVRLFTLLSHKKNMEKRRNLNAERAKVNRTAWFYVWCTKLLLEEVTDFCGRHSRAHYGEPHVVKCEFSQRGGVNLDDVQSYYKYIKEQALLGLSFNDTFPLDWDVVNHEEMFIHPNSMRAGLQLADGLASAFFAAVERAPDGTTKPDFAKHLLPRICRDRRKHSYMYGLKVLPRWKPPTLEPAQKAIFDFYSGR